MDLSVHDCLRNISDKNILSVLARKPPIGFDIYFKLSQKDNEMGTVSGSQKVSELLANLTVVTPIRFTITEVDRVDVGTGSFLYPLLKDCSYYYS